MRRTKTLPPVTTSSLPHEEPSLPPMPAPHFDAPSPVPADETALRRWVARGLQRPNAVSIAGLVLTVAATALLHMSARDRPAPEPSRACQVAVRVDDALLCDEELPRDVATLCGHDHPHEPLNLVAGDAIERAPLCAEPRPRRGEAGWGRMSAEDLAALDQPVDVNTASLAELESLHGVGPKLAIRIAEGRPYTDCNDLLRVHGIGPRTLARMCPRVVVRTPGTEPLQTSPLEAP